MRDWSHLPERFRGDSQFYLNTNLAQGWWTWNKPRGISMVSFLCIAGGGGGGGGHCRAAGAAGSGGGSGACSGVSSVMIPAVLLPDTLFVQVGAGGVGGTNSAVTGTAGGAGGNGSNSYVSIGHSTAIPMVILASGVNAPGGGGGGTASGGGGAGAIPTVITIAALGPLYKLGNPPNYGTAANAGIVGLIGLAGGQYTGANGTAVTAGWNVIPFTPGSGGGGIATTTDFTGGAITLQATTEFPDQYLISTCILAAAAAKDGANGIQVMKPLMGTGGAGGGTSNGGNAGHGGRGAIGCGGGGGGAGLVSGKGGNGGNGLVVITSW